MVRGGRARRRRADRRTAQGARVPLSRGGGHRPRDAEPGSPTRGETR